MQDWSRRAVLAGSLALTAAAGVKAQTPPGIVRLDPSLDALIAPDAPFERIMDGLTLSEGPLWVGGADGYLLVSDVPGNAIHRWSRRDGAGRFLSPSGYAGPPSPMFREAGSNGLVMARGGLVMADSGNRGLALVDMRTKRKTMLCTHYQGRRLNSPNDLVLARDGAIYFTDLGAGLINAGYRELDFTGVFRLGPDNALSLVTDSVTGPNGIGLSPDGRTLYVTERARGWVAFDLDARGAVTNRRYFVATAVAGVGGADGLRIDADGNMWTTTSNGIAVFNPQGEQIGALNAGPGRHSNCELGADGFLYITLGTGVARVPVKARRITFA